MLIFAYFLYELLILTRKAVKKKKEDIWNIKKTTKTTKLFWSNGLHIYMFL